MLVAAMQRAFRTVVLAGAALAAAAVIRVAAQDPPASEPKQTKNPNKGYGPVKGGGGGGAYPQRLPAPKDVLERGRVQYSMQCGLCHGEDARGGDGGPNLIRSQIVLNDYDGDLIGRALNGLPGEPMHRFDFQREDLSDIAAFIHSFRVNGYDISRQRPPTIVVGDAAAGKAYFEQKCSACHSAGGDLKGIGGRIPGAIDLQQRWLMPGGRGGSPAKVTVTPPGVTGNLVRIDDFMVSLTLPDGTPRTFRRNGNNPRVEIQDPLAPHKELLKVYTDPDIHNVTAYLVTLK
jgi:cytochrome c oxidase cbb3-type subunit 3